MAKLRKSEKYVDETFKDVDSISAISGFLEASGLAMV